jgi:restriction endonuclease S subunit
MNNYSIIQKSQLEGSMRLDAEYYQSEYLDLIQKLNLTNQSKFWSEIGGKFTTGPFGSEFNVENYVSNGKFRYIRGKDVKEFFLQEDDNVYIPEDDFLRLIKYSLQAEDILVSVVGTLGNTSIVDSSSLPAIFSCKSTAFRSVEINPKYFIVYLNCKFGKNLLIRNMRGAVQTGLNIDDLKSLLIFVPKENVQNYFANLLDESKNLLTESKNKYLEAEDLLLEELGLKNYRPEEALSCAVNFSEVREVNRIDADFFQPKHAEIVSVIERYGAKELLNLVENIPARFNPAGKADETFKYVELANINSSLGIVDGFSEVLGKEAPSRAKRILKEEDVVISSIGGSLNKVALVDKEHEGSLASTGFFQFRSKDILPEVLLVLSKSLVLQMQLEKQVAGTILAAIPNEALKNLIAPDLPKEIQQKIADLVRQSHEARKKSKELLEEAKRKVEEMIERR